MMAFQGTGVKDSTRHYHGEIAKIILDRWPDHQQEVSTVDETQLANFLPLIAHYSAPRFNAVISVLKSIFPVAGIKLRFRAVKIKERPNLSQLQFSGLLAELDTRPRSHSGLIVRFLSVTGLRIGTARKLRWSDIKGDYILCPGSIMKSGKASMVPFVAGTAEILERLRAVTGTNEFILPSASVQTALRRACRVVGLPRLSHHDFRHLFATRCIESGVDLPTAARWLSHQDGGALLGRVYFHLADAHSREMAQMVRI